MLLLLDCFDLLAAEAEHLLAIEKTRFRWAELGFKLEGSGFAGQSHPPIRISIEIVVLGGMGIYGYGSIPISTVFRGMNIHLPAIFDVHQGYKVLTHCHMGIYGVDHTKPSSITSPPRSSPDGPDGPVAASGRLREVWKIVVQHKVGTVGRHVGSEFNEFQ